MKTSAAEILCEYGPFPKVDHVRGVTFDGKHVWFAAGDKMLAFDPDSGEPVRAIDVPGHAGTAFDGRHLFQIAEDRIQKIDPETGRVLAMIPAPAAAAIRGWRGPKGHSGWASIGAAKSTRSIPTQGRLCGPSSATAW